ncbi:MAG TPA: hypothetical protein VGR92_20345 [Steroidobacteraceae bacterium]|nr:hypothetical protein [Steroidobacteraceae bacterium]
MNRIQKAIAATMALTITLLGSVAVTAPLAFANVRPAAVHQPQSVSGAQPGILLVTVSVRRV